MITSQLQKNDRRKLSKNAFLRPQDMSLTENSKYVFFQGVQQTRKIAHIHVCISVWPLDQLPGDYIVYLLFVVDSFVCGFLCGSLFCGFGLGVFPGLVIVSRIL